MVICLDTELHSDGLDFPSTSGLFENGFCSTYELKEVIGRGLTSTVRRCIERATAIAFAVKVVDVSTERQSEQDAKRLREETLSEIQLLTFLKGHPSIISIHDYSITPTFVFTVFELAMGEMFEHLNRSVTFSEKRARPIMRQLFEGVKFMHENNIVHRDLKLENILCIDDKRVVISDFGFARKIEPGQKLRDLFGTPAYLAPETLRCQFYEDATGYSFEVDNWALGVILYIMLSGSSPFYHREQLKMMRLIQEGRYEFSKSPWESISGDGKDLIRQLLTIDVSKRISARESLQHPWMTVGIVPAIPFEQESRRRSRKDIRRMFVVAKICVSFIIRMKNLKQQKLAIDRDELRKRPFRRREIRHEAEAASFAIYGHWVNRGFHYSRDMLFANKPRPKYVKNKADTNK